MRALLSAVQGLRAHQVRMDVIGNNIANVNTTGFKASRVTFSDAFSESMSGATSPGNLRGGTNGKQIGMGVNVASIDTVMDNGSLQSTGKNTDMAIAGNGFFVLRDAGKFVYTRAGNFDLDAQGFLVNPTSGQRVQGWLPTNGVFPSPDVANATDIVLPVGTNDLAMATTKVTFDQSLNANAAYATGPSPTHTTAFSIIDSLGKPHTLTLNAYKVADNAWDLEVSDPTAAPGNLLTMAGPVYTPPIGAVAGTHGATATKTVRVQFNPDGSLMDNDANPLTPFNLQLNYAPGGGASPMDGTPGNLAPVTIDLNKVIQPAIPGSTTSTFSASDYDGHATGALNNIAVDGRGVITGFYTNGQSRPLAQVAIANFTNAAGLMKEGGSNWVESPNSGHALVGAAMESGRGAIVSNNLEMSNVDISTEFTNMIMTQRGFQANSRIITVSDEMLQDVVNLKR
jgi:flagellar hook protein FlgE